MKAPRGYYHERLVLPRSWAGFYGIHTRTVGRGECHPRQTELIGVGLERMSHDYTFTTEGGCGCRRCLAWRWSHALEDTVSPRLP